MSIRALAAAAGLSASRVHQIVAAADLDELDAALGELRAAGWPAPQRRLHRRRLSGVSIAGLLTWPAVFSKLNGLTRFLAPLLPAPLKARVSAAAVRVSGKVDGLPPGRRIVPLTEQLPGSVAPLSGVERLPGELMRRAHRLEAVASLAVEFRILGPVEVGSWDYPAGNSR